MKLFLDTSTEKCRIWIDENYFEKTLKRDMARDILAFLEESMKNLNCNYSSIDQIVFFAGPGSFTGLRIGASIANTLTDGLEIPIVAAKNPDDAKTNSPENTDEWRQIGDDEIKNGQNDKIAMPFYGAEANITKPRK